MQQQQLELSGHTQMQEQEGSRAIAAAGAASDLAEAQQIVGDPAAAGNSNKQQQLPSELACRLGAVCGSQADC